MVSLRFEPIKLSSIHIICIITNSHNYFALEELFKTWAFEGSGISSSFGAMISLVVDIVVVNAG